MTVLRRIMWTALACAVSFGGRVSAMDAAGEEEFQAKVLPILQARCYDCHANGAEEGSVSFDAFDPELAGADEKSAGDVQPTSAEASPHPDLGDPILWWKVLKQLRAGLMPKDGKKLSADELAVMERWIKSEAFAFNPADPDPGAVTLRRLNRTEYRNTIRDLLDVDFDADGAFPPDDTGFGFDNIGEVLSVSPLLLEKYIEAAVDVISEAVPTSGRVVAEHTIPGAKFQIEGEEPPGEGQRRPLRLSFYKRGRASFKYHVDHDGDYQLLFDVSVNEIYVDGVFDYNKARVTIAVDGEVLQEAEYSWQGEEGDYQYTLDKDWMAGDHEITLDLEPLTPDEKQTRTLSLRLNHITVRGPTAEEFWVKPANYDRFFPTPVPEKRLARRRYATELLRDFATRAFRRPVEAGTLSRLVDVAMYGSARPEYTFEAGVAKAMTAVLASPRFLFREESADPSFGDGDFPFIDQYSLASRLSYFLWSTMPDDELIRLAKEGKLREQLEPQITRMLADKRSESFTRNFVGQWLQARDVDAILINSFVVAARDDKPDPDFDRRRSRFRRLQRKDPEKLTEADQAELRAVRAAFFAFRSKFRMFDLNDELRTAMRRETEMSFEYVVRENRPLTELLDCNYTFLNERLAKHYKIDGVTGGDMRRVKLPPDSPRGGILTQGTTLVVTSNPDRTSPVKRGLFILDNVLGTPPAPPPPGIPALEEQNARKEAVTLTLRDALAKHREDPLCSSCHARMDPLGLALENFNALGIWRDSERGLPIDATGELATGEKISAIKDLKYALAENHRVEFYRVLTEKMMTYALGRGLDYHDVGVVDGIVDQLDKDGGRPAALIRGIVESAPFQKRRPLSPTDGDKVASETASPADGAQASLAR